MLASIAWRPSSNTRNVIITRGFTSSGAALSGHNKWSKIRHDKAIQDAKKNSVYNKMAKDVTVAARVGGGLDPALNPALAAALKKANKAGVPKDNIERALAKVDPNFREKDTGQELVYEIMTPSKVGIICECYTDNPTRTRHSLRAIINDHNARFTSTAFLFKKKGIIQVALRADKSFDDLLEAAVEGAEDISQEEGSEEVEIIVPPEQLNSLTTILSSPPHSYVLTESEIRFLPTEDAALAANSLTDEERRSLEKLLEALESDNDVIKAWSGID